MTDEAKKTYDYFVDAKKYETNQTGMTGAQIKASASADPTYQLFLEEEGETPDKLIADSEVVDMAHRVKHFYAVPPATFGRG